jgi:cytidylate kinase
MELAYDYWRMAGSAHDLRPESIQEAVSMAIVTISRGSNSHGREIAALVAEELGYECVARKVLLEASEEFNIPEFKLEREIHDTPGLFERFSRRKERYVSYIRTALLEHVQKDNVVYHGLAGHVFLKDVSHVLKVRIVADLRERAEEEMKQEGITYNQARQRLLKDDEERRRWSQALYGIDNQYPGNYDLCIQVQNINIKDAVKLIVETTRSSRFQTTEESQKTLDDALLRSRIENRLVGSYDVVDMDTNGGNVLIKLQAPFILQDKLSEQIRFELSDLNAVRSVQVDVEPTGFEF